NATNFKSNALNSLRKEEFPFVFLDRIKKENTDDTVIVNNISGAEKGVQHLINLGHKRIAIIVYTLGERSPRIDRLEGYKQTLLENNIDLDPSLIKVITKKDGEGVKKTKELLKQENKPTAFFSTHSLLNLEILTGKKQSSYKIPDDISLVGYDDFPWVPLLDPPLTTIAQPAFDLGVKSTSVLLEKIKQESKKIKEIIQLEPEIRIRKSSYYQK